MDMVQIDHRVLSGKPNKGFDSAEHTSQGHFKEEGVQAR